MPVIDTVEPVRIADLGKDILVPRPDFEAWLERFDWTFHQVARGEFPPGYVDLVEFQIGCICADPALWVPCFLREPEDPDHQDPWSLWDYQKEGLRYRGSKVYDCGAETGKSRDIIADNLYCAFTIANGSGLVGAPQQTHLDEIIEGMHDQLCYNPDLMPSLKRWKKHPHHAMYFVNGFKIDFRPSGHDGEAFRGVHVRTFAKLDEAAKMKNPRQWSEFWRAMKPGCTAAIYSVTDGDRSCDFYKLKERAKLKSNAVTDSGDLRDMPSHLKKLTFRHFCWPKTIMPYPYWSEERRQFYIEQYGGNIMSQTNMSVVSSPAYSEAMPSVCACEDCVDVAAAVEVAASYAREMLRVFNVNASFSVVPVDKAVGGYDDWVRYVEGSQFDANGDNQTARFHFYTGATKLVWDSMKKDGIEHIGGNALVGLAIRYNGAEYILKAVGVMIWEFLNETSQEFMNDMVARRYRLFADKYEFAEGFRCFILGYGLTDDEIVFFKDVVRQYNNDLKMERC